jgi:hypothetical protein
VLLFSDCCTYFEYGISLMKNFICFSFDVGNHIFHDCPNLACGQANGKYLQYKQFSSEIYKWLVSELWQPLWSSGQSSWLQMQRSRVRLPALPDFFLRSSGSGTGSTQPRDDSWGAISRKWRLRSRKPKLSIMGESLRWPRDTVYPLKLALTSPTSGGRSVGRYSSLADSSHGV